MLVLSSCNLFLIYSSETKGTERVVAVRCRELVQNDAYNKSLHLPYFHAIVSYESVTLIQLSIELGESVFALEIESRDV